MNPTARFVPAAVLASCGVACLIALGLALAPTHEARAAPPAPRPGGSRGPAATVTDDPREDARVHYAAGIKAFQEERFADAVREFEQAYVAVPDPVFMFNLAQTYRLAGDRDKAIRFYERYLRLAPKARNRTQVRETIAELQAAPPTPVVAPAAAPTASQPADKPRNVGPNALDADVVSRPDPHLPNAVKLRLRGGEATFVSRVCVGRDGAVSSVKVLQGISGADESVVSTIRTWRYKPQPTPVCFVASWVFQME